MKSFFSLIFSFINGISHEALFRIAIPTLIFLWILCLTYALLIFPGRLFFRETYLDDDEAKNNCNCCSGFCQKSDDVAEKLQVIHAGEEIELMAVCRNPPLKLLKSFSVEHEYFNSEEKRLSDIQIDETSKIRPHSSFF
jgi:hypothetical protein